MAHIHAAEYYATAIYYKGDLNTNVERLPKCSM
jgi:hypothetical protein